MHSKDELIRAFRLAKEAMETHFSNGQYDDGLYEAEVAANLAMSFPITHEYVDDQLETALQEQFLSKIGAISHTTTSKKVVFYNTQIVDRGALTQQYLSFLTCNDYEVLLVVPHRRNALLGSEIKEFVSAHKNVELYFPKGRILSKMMVNLKAKIEEFRPEITFIHLVPDDVMGFSFFSNFQSSIKYYIVHNDHTFWLGKLCADYFLEFRDFGFQIATERRNISPHKIIRTLYYPINEGNKFKGFPFDRRNKIVGLLAANPYKFMLDKEKTILNVLLEKIKEHENFVVVIAGRRSRELNDFIKRNKLENKFYYLGHRTDFYALMKNIDIYINSFPLIGGLTTQYAAETGCPIVSYTKPELLSTNSAEGFLKYCKEQITFSNLEEFKARLSQLITNESLRHCFKDKEVMDTVSKLEFDKKLSEVIANPEKHVESTRSNTKLKHIDSVFLDYYLQRLSSIELIRAAIKRKYNIQKRCGEFPFVLRYKMAMIAKKMIFKNKF